MHVGQHHYITLLCMALAHTLQLFRCNTQDYPARVSSTLDANGYWKTGRGKDILQLLQKAQVCSKERTIFVVTTVLCSTELLK
jgi:hypothetical protein